MKNLITKVVVVSFILFSFLTSCNNKPEQKLEEGFHDNGDLASRKIFKNDILISETFWYKDGKKDINLYKNGKVASEKRFYKNGCQDFIYTYKNGKLISMDYWHLDGSKSFTRTYKDENMLFSKSWDKNGTIRFIFDSKDKSFINKRFHGDGSLKEIGTRVDNALVPQWVYIKGTLEPINVKLNVLVCKGFYKNGAKKFIDIYESGRLIH